jgi:lambda family phage portal protein
MFDFLKRKPKPIKRRNYMAANIGRLFNDFVSGDRSADSELKFQLKLIRDRSRDLARNNEYAKRYLSLVKTNVIGERGFTLQVKARNSDGSLDYAGNNIIENAWKAWGRLGNCTVDGRLSWLDAQRQVVEAIKRDGEIFIQKVKGRGYRDGFAINLIEADRVDELKNERLSNGNVIRMGVELDQNQRVAAYHVLTTHPGDYEFAVPQSRKHIRIPADQIIHVYEQLRPGQTRGEPSMAPAMAALKMLHGLREAELVAARTAASKMGFFTSPSGDGFAADDYEENHIPMMNAEPGTFHQLPAGVSFTAFDPNHPTTAFDSFQKSILRGIAGGLGVSYTSLSNDLEATSYSSIRQGALEERDAYRTLQSFMIEHFVEPVFRAWLTQALDFGSIPIPGSKFDKFADNAMFRGRGWQWVDPLKEMNAAVIGLQNGVLSMQDVQANYGRDVEETLTQIQRDKEQANALGLKYAFEPFGATQMPVEPTINDGESE